MVVTELKRILDEHAKWLNNDGGEKADLREANLREANLHGANLCRADLRKADLSGANLCGVDLHEANLRGVDLHEANLRGADLCGANLCGANLCRADLRGADLREADLSRANLCGVDLDFSCLPLRCGGLRWKIDRRIAAQLAYHFCSMECDDLAFLAAREGILDFANTFHRAQECGVLKKAEIKEGGK
jgi:hypothetical protein